MSLARILSINNILALQFRQSRTNSSSYARQACLICYNTNADSSQCSSNRRFFIRGHRTHSTRLVCAALLFRYNRKRKCKGLNGSKGTFRVSPLMGKYQEMSLDTNRWSIESTNHGGDRETGLQAQYITSAHGDGETWRKKEHGHSCT